jgi:hypothetical protein
MKIAEILRPEKQRVFKYTNFPANAVGEHVNGLA